MSGGLASDHWTIDAGGSCPTCGFRPDTVSAGDSVVAVRSFPRRFRAAMASVDGEDPGDILRRRVAPGGWSALEHAGHVRDILHAVDLRLRRVMTEDGVPVPALHQTPPADVHDQPLEAVLSTLATNAGDLAHTMSRIAGEDWLRCGVRNGHAVTALDLAREAVHEGAHHLRALERVVREARGKG